VSDTGVLIPSQEEAASELHVAKKHAYNFTIQLNKMKPVLRFAVLSLISSKKVSIFNESLASLMAKIN